MKESMLCSISETTVAAGVSPAVKNLCSRHGCLYSSESVIKNRPHRLDLIFAHEPLYFVTFCTRNRKTISSLEYAQTALEEYGRLAIDKYNVGLGRYVIMPDHVHLFVRG